MWGYVRGGMGMVSFYFCDAAREAGAIVVSGVPVARILPGEGVLLEGGERIAAPIVVSNADPRQTLRLLGDAADPAWRARVEQDPHRRLHRQAQRASARAAQLHRPPRHRRAAPLRPDQCAAHKAEWKSRLRRRARGELPEHLWCELYFQSVHDPIRRSRRHAHHERLRAIRALQVSRKATGTSAATRCASSRSIPSPASAPTSIRAVIDAQVLGPPDIEKKVGLTGGHIFQGECLPPYMWDNRLTARTPMPGVYLCGACTHPGGSVIGVNGRNAAMAVLRDQAP